jgi:hypothetical protein
MLRKVSYWILGAHLFLGLLGVMRIMMQVATTHPFSCRPCVHFVVIIGRRSESYLQPNRASTIGNCDPRCVVEEVEAVLPILDHDAPKAHQAATAYSFSCHPCVRFIVIIGRRSEAYLGSPIIHPRLAAVTPAPQLRRQRRLRQYLFLKVALDRAVTLFDHRS